MKGAPILAAAIAMVCAAATDAPRSRPAASTPLYWLEKAEAAAKKIDNTERDSFPPKPRDYALSMVACTYLDLGHIERARAVAGKLPEDDKRRIELMVPVYLAHAGRFDAAVREARALKHARLMQLVAAICAKKDVPRALRIASEVPASHRGGAYADIARQQVLRGDVDGARRTAAKIRKQEHKRQTELWLAAGSLAEEHGDIRKAAERRAVKIEQIEDELSAICEARAEAVQLDRAGRILKALSKPQHRSRACVAIAKCHLRRADRTRFRKAVDQALAEASAIQDAELGSLLRAVRYTEIARLQVLAGDLDAAAKTVRLAHRSSERESATSRPGGKGLGVFENLGGKLALVELLVSAGRVEEARKMATADDGAVMPQAVPLLVQAYAAEGKARSVERLLKSLRPGEIDYQIYLAAAKGASERMRAASRPAR